MIHELKIDVPYFEQVLSGDKTFEIRYNDRGFQKGDQVILREIRTGCITTGRSLQKMITYVTSFQQKDHWVVFGITDISEGCTNEETEDSPGP